MSIFKNPIDVNFLIYIQQQRILSNCFRHFTENEQKCSKKSFFFVRLSTRIYIIFFFFSASLIDVNLFNLSKNSVYTADNK